MRIALAVHQVSRDLSTNLGTVLRRTTEAAVGGADMIVFSEAALSGFVANGDPDHDRDLADVIPGPTTSAIAETANRLAIAIAFGMYERDHTGRLFDSGVLIDRDGEIQLHYRRNSPQWHRAGDDPFVYRQGSEIPLTHTSFGRTCMVLCGDLFDDVIMNRVAALRPDLLLVPFAREFDSEVADEACWHATELDIYARRSALSGAVTALVNQIGPGTTVRNHFGAAFFVDDQGNVTASLAPNIEGLLFQGL